MGLIPTILTVEQKEFIRRKIEENAHLPAQERNKEIINEVRRKYGIIISRHQIYRIMQELQEIRDNIAGINDEVEEKKKWEVVDNWYYFYGKHATYKLTVEQVDCLFKDYSKYGANLSGEEICRKYMLKPEAFQLIKSSLRLFKASHVISPHTAETSSEEELDGKVEEAIGAHRDAVREKMVSTHERRFKEEAKKAIAIVANVDNFMAHIQERMETMEFPEYKIKAKPNNNPGEFAVMFSDTHFRNGKYEEVEARMNEISDAVISRKEGTANIFFLGDLAETLSAEMMHDSQARVMERHDVFDTVLMIADIFERFIVRIAESGKKVNFYGIGGNHDRISRLHDQDIRRSGALFTFEMIKRAIHDARVKVEYFTEKINKVESGGLSYLFHHGDDSFSNRKPEDILWKNGTQGKHNIIVHGDKHTITAKETKSATMIGVPALCGQGEYDKRLDLHSEPGYVMVEENRHGTADVSIKRL